MTSKVLQENNITVMELLPKTKREHIKNLLQNLNSYFLRGVKDYTPPNSERNVRPFSVILKLTVYKVVYRHDFGRLMSNMI